MEIEQFCIYTDIKGFLRIQTIFNILLQYSTAQLDFFIQNKYSAFAACM